MQTNVIVLIVLIEALLLALLVAGALYLYARKLKRQLEEVTSATPHPEASKKEKGAGKPEEAMATIDETPVHKTRAAPATKTYTQYIDQQIFALRAHHEKLEGAQDLALDIDPGAPLDRRIAAVRNAVLIAEREATLEGEVNWEALKSRYKAILSYYEDYPSPKAEARIHELSESLNAAKQEVQSLEKYKSLFFDVEAKWHASQTQADAYYQQIRDRVELTDSSQTDKDHLISLVGDYRNSYQGVTDVFASHTPLPTTIEAATEELKALRQTTSEQNRLIDHLKKQISSATDDNAKVALIRGLEEELNRQQRFIKESESCVRLLEYELSTAHKEIVSLKGRLKDLPNLRAQLKDLQEEEGVREVMVGRLKDEVRKLKKALATHPKSALPGGSGEVDTAALEEELAVIKKQYADLEERYLDLQLGGE